MSSVAESSMMSTTSRTQSPLYGVGRILGSVTFKLLRSSQNMEKVIKFVVCLGLLFNLRIYRKVIPEKGYFTFFVSTPREGEFNPQKNSSRANSYMTSFKISEETLKTTPPLPSPFCSIEKMSWNELRELSGGLLPEVPKDIEHFKNVFSNFVPELMSQKGNVYSEIAAEASAIRQTFEEISKKNDINDFL